MRKDLKQTLREKGWPEDEISRASRIMSHAEKHKKTALVKFLDNALYWMILIVMLLGNFAISVVLIPFLVVLNSYQLYLMIIVTALAFGLLFTLLIRDIDSLTKTHYIVAGIFIPAIAIMNIFIITGLANLLIPFMHVKNSLHSPFLIGIVYGVAFMIPYIFYKATDRLDKHFTSL